MRMWSDSGWRKAAEQKLHATGWKTRRCSGVWNRESSNNTGTENREAVRLGMRGPGDGRAIAGSRLTRNQICVLRSEK